MALLTILRNPFNPKDQFCVLTPNSIFTNPDCKEYMKKNLEKGIDVTVASRFSKAQEVDDFAGIARNASADFIVLDLRKVHSSNDYGKEKQDQEWEGCRIVDDRVFWCWDT